MLNLVENKKFLGNTYSAIHYIEYTRGNKSIFEDVVDKMMLDEVAGMNEFFRKAIEKLDNSKKRMAILSLLDKDRNLFTRIKSLMGQNLSKIDHIRDVIIMLREYVKVGEVERKKYGEVMTPLELVKEMLNTLPEQVWTNPNLKWLDSCNGSGPFLIMIIYKLMIGLKDWEPDEEKRYRHIVENMIHAGELQPKNMFLYMCVVDPWNKYDLNLYTGSFLEQGFDNHMKEIWNVDKFDIIVGNPPYQEHKEGFSKTKPLWNLFVTKSMEIIAEGGFLNMVHPGGWRSPMGIFRNIYECFRSRNLIFLSINDFNKGQEVFGVGTNFDYYCLENSKNVYKKTIIIDSDDNRHVIDLNDFNFIPNGDFYMYSQLIASNGEEKVDILYSRSSYGSDKSNMSKFVDDQFTYPCVYTITKKDGIKLLYSNTNKNGHFGISKLIWSNGLGTYPIIDYNGEYGLTQFSYAIIDDTSNLEKLKKAMNSERFLRLMNYAKFTNNKYDYKVISTFKKNFFELFI